MRTPPTRPSISHTGCARVPLRTGLTAVLWCCYARNTASTSCVKVTSFVSQLPRQRRHLFVWVPDSMTKAVNIVECLMAALVPGAAPHPAMNTVSPKYREICTKIQGVLVSSEGDPPFKKSAKESLLAKVRSCLEEARSQVWRAEEAIVSVYSLLMIFRKGATRSSRQSRQCLQSF